VQLQPHRRDFRGALLKRAPAIIAEIKKASPSKGLLSANFDPSALSVLIDQVERGGVIRL